MARMTNPPTHMPAKLPQNRLTATQNATIGSQTATKSCPLPQAKYNFSGKSEGKIHAHKNIPMAVKTFSRATAMFKITESLKSPLMRRGRFRG